MVAGKGFWRARSYEVRARRKDWQRKCQYKGVSSLRIERLDAPVEMTEYGEKEVRKGIRLNGRGERIRTSDPLLPKQVRYQTALRPEP